MKSIERQDNSILVQNMTWIRPFGQLRRLVPANDGSYATAGKINAYRQFGNTLWRRQASFAPRPEREAIEIDSAKTSGMTSSVAGSPQLVSIIIPYFNHASYLVEAVESARNQAYPNVEIIVVDDGSEVPASSLLEGMEDVTLIRTKNGGVSSARNVGFEKCSGEYIIFLDSDDRLLPGAVEAHLDAFISNPNAGMTFGPARIIDGNGLEMAAPSICRPRKDYFPMLLESNPIACPGSTMIRRQAFVSAGRFDTSFRNAEDYHLYLRIARQVAVVQHSVCVVDYRKHSGGKSNNLDRMTNAIMAILDEYDADPSLSRFERKTLARGRNRWLHSIRPKDTLAYRLKGLYYRFRAMLTVPVRHYFRFLR